MAEIFVDVPKSWDCKIKSWCNFISLLHCRRQVTMAATTRGGYIFLTGHNVTRDNSAFPWQPNPGTSIHHHGKRCHTVTKRYYQTSQWRHMMSLWQRCCTLVISKTANHKIKVSTATAVIHIRHLSTFLKVTTQLLNRRRHFVTMATSMATRRPLAGYQTMTIQRPSLMTQTMPPPINARQRRRGFQRHPRFLDTSFISAQLPDDYYTPTPSRRHHHPNLTMTTPIGRHHPKLSTTITRKVGHFAQLNKKLGVPPTGRQGLKRKLTSCSETSSGSSSSDDNGLQVLYKTM